MRHGRKNVVGQLAEGEIFVLVAVHSWPVLEIRSDDLASGVDTETRPGFIRAVNRCATNERRFSFRLGCADRLSHGFVSQTSHSC